MLDGSVIVLLSARLDSFRELDALELPPSALIITRLTHPSFPSHLITPTCFYFAAFGKTEDIITLTNPQSARLLNACTLSPAATVSLKDVQSG